MKRLLVSSLVLFVFAISIAAKASDTGKFARSEFGKKLNTQISFQRRYSSRQYCPPPRRRRARRRSNRRYNRAVRFLRSNRRNYNRRDSRYNRRNKRYRRNNRYRRNRSVLSRHRNVRNIAIGTGAGAIIGGILGGKKGALVGAGVGAGSGAAYTYVIRPKNKRKSRKRYVRRRNRRYR